MTFKIDENLPTEYVSLLKRAGFPADTVLDEKLSGTDDDVVFIRCQMESRIFMTLDLDFANVQAYPPESHFGIVVFRSKSQDKKFLISLLERLLPYLAKHSPLHQLWIVEPDRIGIRQ